MDYSARLIMMKLWLCLLALLFTACAHGPRTGEPRTRVGGMRSSGSCQPLTSEERERILSAANPSNFPRTRYRRGPSSLSSIERETDCSRFVHEIYRRAGLPYAFRATKDLGDAQEFDILPEAEAQPGDLMLFRGHVGIVDEDGQIISAVSTRHRKRRSSIAKMDRSNFHSFRGRYYVLRYRCAPTEAARSTASVRTAKASPSRRRRATKPHTRTAANQRYERNDVR